MKKIISLLIVIFCIAACKKENKPSVQNYMRFKLDGVQVECDRYHAPTKDPLVPEANISFYGLWGDANPLLANALDFQIFTYATTDITPGQYLFGPGKAYYAELWPNGGSNTSYFAGRGTQAPGPIAGSGQITIIEINADYIKGSFDFITGVNSGTGLFKTVTNGEFLIKRR